MAAEGRVLYNYSGEYKKGLLGKKKISATLYEDYIEGVGAEYYVGELREVPFKLNISDIKKVEIKEINDNKCIQIEYVPENEEERAKGNSKLLLPNVAKIDEAKKVLYDLVDKLFQEATQKAILERAKRDGAKKFYAEKMESYGLNGENTYLKLMDQDMQYVGFSADKNAVSVIAIDGQNLQDGKFSIAYDKVRYYGKVENITEKYDAISQLEFDGVSIDISGQGSVVLTYKNVNGKYVALKLPAEIYDALEKTIPAKEFTAVIAAEKAEAERMEAERLEAERIAREKAEKEEAERLAKEKAEKEEAERIAKEKAEAERIAKEKAEKEEAERLAKEKAEKEEAERIAREKAEAEKAEAERIAKEKAEAEAAEAERIAKEKAEAEAAEAERIAKEKTEAEKAEAEKAAKEKAEKAEKATEKKPEAADDMVAFEKRIKKLMIMKNTGILNDEEFEAERQKLFDML